MQTILPKDANRKKVEPLAHKKGQLYRYLETILLI